MQIDVGRLDGLMPEPQPDHRISTPAWRSSIAALCRRTCGVTRLRRSDGQSCAAVATCRASKPCTGSGLRALPWMLGNSFVEPRCPASLSQVWGAWRVCVVSGVQRSLRSLPRHRTCVPAPRTTTSRSSWTISDNRGLYARRGGAARDRSDRSSCSGLAPRGSR
jgi:hypothetical protein